MSDRSEEIHSEIELRTLEDLDRVIRMLKEIQERLRKTLQSTG